MTLQQESRKLVARADGYSVALDGALGHQVEVKRAFYRRPEVAASYETQRFGGASGARVNQRELDIASTLLPIGGVMADVGCGTGRLLPLLRHRADNVIGFDASMPMLHEACERLPGALVQADAFSLPIANGVFDAVASLRLLFHFDNPAPLLREFRRVTRPGGTLVCDTSSWSPRSLLPLGQEHWGDRVATIRRPDFRSLVEAAGWRVRAEKPCYFISPYMYRRLPLPIVRGIEALEAFLPTRLLCRDFWALEAV
jgi:SAM-dependent methyltransferase